MVTKNILIVLVVIVLISSPTCAVDDPDYDLFTSEETAEPEQPDEVIGRFNKGTVRTYGLESTFEIIYFFPQVCGDDLKCVDYYLCSENREIITDGQFIIDERFDKGVVKKCESAKVCCERKTLVPVVPKKQKCSNYKNAKSCGFRNKMGVGTHVASKQPHIQYPQFGEFPWSMALMNNTGRTLTLLGGGSLIHPKVVVTSAHITARMPDHTKIKVRGGEYNTQITDEICPHMDRNVEKIISHEEFHRPTLINSIALIVLSHPFDLSPTINIICLPLPKANFDGDLCITTGWGKENFMSPERYQVFPKLIELPVVPRNECQEMLRNTQVGEDFILHENFLCAGK